MKTAKIIILWALLGSCGTGNKAEDRVEKTPDEQIRIALDNNDLATARTLLEQQITAEPDNYSRYPVLGAVYANLGGFDIFKAVSHVSDLSGGKSPLDSIGQFLPDSPTKDNVDLLDKASAIILQMPTAKRASTAEESYASSAAFQLALYQTAYSITYMKLFIKTDPLTQKLDPSKLSSMTVQDASAILKSLKASAGNMSEIAGSEEVAAQINTAIADIDAQPGATDDEKLANYIAAKKAAG